MCTVHTSCLDDFPGWLLLAAEVEPLFGPMVGDPSFCDGLRGAILDGSALCVRDADDGRRGSLRAGIVVSAEANEILWFSVARASRGRGIGKVLLAEAIGRLRADRPIVVTTFAPAIEAGRAARTLYQRFGFRDADKGELNPAGIPTVVMIRPAVQAAGGVTS